MSVIDYSQSIMSIVEKHLSPTPKYVDGRRCFGAGELVCDGETERVIGEVKGGACAAIREAPKEFAGGLRRKAAHRARFADKKEQEVKLWQVAASGTFGENA